MDFSLLVFVCMREVNVIKPLAFNLTTKNLIIILLMKIYITTQTYIIYRDLYTIHFSLSFCLIFLTLQKLYQL